MIELTPEQVRALGQASGQPPTLIDPTNQTVYVLLRQDDYERLRKEDDDDSSWTEEERGALAAELEALLDDDLAIEEA
jgi:hypothetical protein